MNRKVENIVVAGLLFSFLGIFTTIIFNTENSFGGGDHFSHFKLAFWGWKYPDFLFNHWGKPVFTLLISPFAQFGVNGARFYNVILGISTAFVTWKLARYFRFHMAWAVVILVLFIPIYFILMFTSLTEVSFSFFLIFSIYLFFKNKHIWSALVLSFLPIVRTEGIILIPIFILAWSLKRKFVAIPFILVGFLIVSFMGKSYYSSFWWLITEMPYTGSASSIYGSGTLLHFIDHISEIISKPYAWLFIAGSLVILYKWIWKDKGKLSNNFYFLLLIVGSFVTFFAAHSFLWWQGLGNSLGLIRVIGSVTPLTALTIIALFSFLVDKSRKNLRIPLMALISIFIIWISFENTMVHRYGFAVSKSQLLLSKSIQFLQNEKLTKHKIFYFNPYVAYKMGLDPYDANRSKAITHIENWIHILAIPDSSIIIWDAHFGPNEGRTQLDEIHAQPYFKEIAIFNPEVSYKVIGGYDYKVVVFQKNLSLTKKLKTKLIDFEANSDGNSEFAYKGKASFKMKKDRPYKTLLSATIQEISDSLVAKYIEVDLAFNFLSNERPNKLVLVCSIESDGEILYYKKEDISKDKDLGEVWHQRTFYFELPKPKTMNDILKIYVWNFGGNEFLLDEIHINIISTSPKE